MREPMSDASKPWRIKSVRTVYNNKWIAVREYQAVAPTGAETASVSRAKISSSFSGISRCSPRCS